MKKYIGTQQVEAEPMTMGEAYRRNLLQTGRVPNDSEKDNPGFYIRYQDGYENWSPAESFCKAYKFANTPLDRMIIEREELNNKIDKLRKFICSEKFNSLNDKQRILLNMQLHSMIEYSLILKEIISNI